MTSALAQGTSKIFDKRSGRRPKQIVHEFIPNPEGGFLVRCRAQERLQFAVGMRENKSCSKSKYGTLDEVVYHLRIRAGTLYHCYANSFE
jgi:hypothetical protein